MGGLIHEKTKQNKTEAKFIRKRASTFVFVENPFSSEMVSLDKINTTRKPKSRASNSFPPCHSPPTLQWSLSLLPHVG